MDDARLSALLEDAVADVEPADRIDEIRARMRPSRRAWWVAGGALVATAATVLAVAVVDGGPTERAVDPVGEPTVSPSEEMIAEPVTVYWVAETPGGPRLFGESTRVDLGYGESLLRGVVRTAVRGRPDDPDYRNPWKYTSVRSVRRAGEGVTVTLSLGLDGSAPYLGVEQIASTVWALVGPEVPVTVDVLTEGPRRPVTVTSRDDLAALSPVQISSPLEGQEVRGSFAARGLANSYEATVPWRLEDEGGTTVLDGFATAEGWGDAVYPWQSEVDVTGLEPGTYTFLASTSDPSDGEGPGPTTDTRTVYVR